MVNKDSYTAVRQLREHEAELLEVKGMDQIMMKPIGVIHSPYTEVKDMPIQGASRISVSSAMPSSFTTSINLTRSMLKLAPF